MLVRIIGIADQVMDVNKADYLKAKEERRLHEFMKPYVDRLEFEVVYAPAKAFH